ncbi:MAG TPA: alpha/beta fold hydrolase [Longimicrobium sp.]|jgi:pimeloyl-ACP methyl ester carboxylesterase|uniref:alpha/beta fold hydrolase n=1 Tax=Longimicrobium sp. TaxID=2029185 RepID=UPI002ED87C1D
MMRNVRSLAGTVLNRLPRAGGVAVLGALLAAGVSTAQPAPAIGGRAADAAHVVEAAAPRAGDTRELVVLVHGMGRTPLSMGVLGRRLERDGYRVVRFGYRSTRGSVAELGAALGRRAAQRTGDAPRVHFIGHSLGTVIIRSMIAQAPPERTGRVVMLAPPNQGSAAADRWAPWIGWAMPPIRELRTVPGSTARTLALPEGAEVGIIAGARDHKVRVAETYLAGARDHVVVPGFHTFLMNRPDVHRLVLRFLRTGRFSETEAPGEPVNPPAPR